MLPFAKKSRARSFAPPRRKDLAATARSPFQIAEFRALWVAEALSQTGDQLARVALSMLVFSSTGSAALAAFTLGLSYVPSLIGAALLSGLADRFSTRDVLIGCDLISAGLLVVMTVPDAPLWLIFVAIASVAVVGGPFRAARQALLPEVLKGEAYVAGLAIRTITVQIAQLLGFVGGAALVVLLSPPLALIIDAATFLLSAVIVRFGVDRRRPAAAPARRSRFWASSLDGARLIRAVPGLPALYALSMLSGFFIAPEGLAVAWVAEMGEPEEAAGLVMGAPAAGLVIGSFLISRLFGPANRSSIVGPAAAATGLALTACTVQPGLWVALALLMTSGTFRAYQVQVTASFGQLIPTPGRAQVMGLLNAGLLSAQGIGVLIAGLVAQEIGVAHTVALFGAIASAIAVPTGMVWYRSTQARLAASAVPDDLKPPCYSPRK